MRGVMAAIPLARSAAMSTWRTSAIVSIAGFSLIECLVALVVLAMGMLGTATLILEGLRNAHLALLRTQAVNLVSDMIERIRANPSAGPAYECAAYTAGAADAGGPAEHGCASNDAVLGTLCTPAELAEDDLARWVRAARATLPQNDDACAANVSYIAAGAAGDVARYRVSVSWLARGEPAPLMYESDLLLASLR
jgi:type IV pilus assembly protein PilV